ncbi:hypothetical protein CE91St41_20720 [Oscillospiraceae bacterium]|nr:hypothetical protein CE91St40_16800 [Oscillospiraceae bacterium]BDF75183.1 hypothetical protein CE91St41_20720 [Oscillospiraceae bacterium]
MKRILTLSLAAVLLVAAIAGCSGKGGGNAGESDKQLTPEERTELYKTSIENARDAETNEYMSILTSADDDGASMILELLGLKTEDMTAFAVSASMMNVQAYGIAAVMPAAGKEDAVLEGLNGFIDLQKQNFQQYLIDQYDIANNAKLETLEDGTILLVMSEGQDAIFDSIKDAVEAGK